MNYRNSLMLLLVLLSFPLMGLSQKEAFGCGCSGDEETTSLEKGGTAASKNYLLDRAGLGASFGSMISSKGSYRLNATIGNSFSKESSDSNHYKTSHALSREIVIAPSRAAR